MLAIITKIERSGVVIGLLHRFREKIHVVHHAGMDGWLILFWFQY
jgi:hypothetical protein